MLNCTDIAAPGTSSIRTLKSDRRVLNGSSANRRADQSRWHLPETSIAAAGSVSLADQQQVDLRGRRSALEHRASVDRHVRGARLTVAERGSTSVAHRLAEDTLAVAFFHSDSNGIVRPREPQRFVKRSDSPTELQAWSPIRRRWTQSHASRWTRPDRRSTTSKKYFPRSVVSISCVRLPGHGPSFTTAIEFDASPRRSAAVEIVHSHRSIEIEHCARWHVYRRALSRTWMRQMREVRPMRRP